MSGFESSLKDAAASELVSDAIATPFRYNVMSPLYLTAARCPHSPTCAILLADIIE